MKLLINGEWRDSVSGEAFAVYNPATGDVVGEAPLGGEDDVRSAVEAAGEALTDWSAKNPRDRAKILFFAAEEVRRRNRELGSLLTTEQGKPIREAVDEINGFANILEYYYALSAGERGSFWTFVAMATPSSTGARSVSAVRSSPGTCRRSSWAGRSGRPWWPGTPWS